MIRRIFLRINFGLFLIAAVTSVGFCQDSDARRMVEIPFTFEHNEIIVQAKLNGRVHDMLLDTGTNVTAVEITTAKTLGLKISTESIQGSGEGTDKNPVYLTKLSLVELGGLAAKDLLAGATDLSKLSHQIGRPIDGVLGYDLLKDRIIQIDYPRRVVRFYSASPFSHSEPQPNSERRVRLPFRFVSRVPIIADVYVNDKKIRAVVDTGSSQTFSLTAKAVRSLGLEEDVKSAEPDTTVGYMGQAMVKKGKVRSIRVGTVSMDSPVVTFFISDNGNNDRPYEGNIGNVFMKDFVVTFDYRNKEVVFERP